MSSLFEIIQSAVVEKEPDLPFPQANSIYRVIEAIEHIYKKQGINNSELGKKLSVSSRQGQYYGTACAYLGFAIRVKTRNYRYYITELGTLFFNSNPDVRNILLIEQMVKHGLFNYFMNKYVDEFQPPTKNDVIQYMIQHPEIKVSGKTIGRRAESALKWIDWAFGIAHEDV